MNANVAEKSGYDIQNEYWTVGKWFSLLIMVLLAWFGIYIISHAQSGIPGYEYTHFTTAEVRQINRILTTESVAAPPVQRTIQPATLIDTDASMAFPAEVNDGTSSIQTTGCDFNCRTDKALAYIASEYDNNITAAQLQSLRQYISTFGPQEMGVFLADYKLKVRSYFWLSGPMLYAEIIFWVIAGVLCSLIFSVGLSFRRSQRTGYEHKDILYQVAKIFYAPFITLILVLTYNYFKENTTLNANLGQGVLVFGFIAGLYSGRFMNFLNNLKHLVLPGNDGTYIAAAMTPAMDMQQQMSVAPIMPGEVPTGRQTADEPHEEEALAVDSTGNLNINGKLKPKPSEDGLIDVEVEIKLDGSTMFDDEKDQLLRKGFNKAIVTLHNVNGRDIIPARKSGDGSIFIASAVKPGIYIARATLSQRMNDDQIINLFGERTSYITVDKPGLELYMRKYELAD